MNSSLPPALPSPCCRRGSSRPKPAKLRSPRQTPPPPPPEEAASKAADGLLINGSVNNAATSQFSLAPRFGNTASGKSMYNVTLFARIDNSALDARSYSLAGFNTPKPETDQFTGGITVGGPLKIPGLLRNGPNILFSYQRTRNSISVTTPGLVPTLAERAGILPFAIYDSANNTNYAAGSVVPITPQAQALINLYPLPNLLDNNVYNYQVPLVTDTHQDFFNSNASKTIGRKNQINGTFASQSIRTSSTSLLGFTDATGALGLNTNITWAHTYNAHLRFNVGYTFSRQSNRTTPFWANRTNISGTAGITGNDQDPAYWGPPTLNFSSALAPLTDANNTFLRNATNGVSYVLRWNRSPHNITVGGDFRRQQFNYLTQANPRGTFTFSTANAGGTGSDVADFLLGLPAASSIAYGNADKYLRESVYDLYGTDDWRVTPQLTVNAGVRWEYGSPVTELKNRLVNLDVVSDFAAVAPVLASAPKGATHRHWLSHVADPPGPHRGRAAHRPLVAAAPRFLAGRRRRLRRHVRYLRLPGHRAQHGPAGSALDQPDRPEQRGLPAVPGPRLHALQHHHRRDLRRRSQLPRRLRADLAAQAAARSALLAPGGGHLSRQQGHTRRAALSAQHRRRNRPERLRIPHLRRRLHARVRPDPAAPDGSKAASPHRSSTPSPSPSTTTPRWAARARPRLAPPPSRRTGAT